MAFYGQFFQFLVLSVMSSFKTSSIFIPFLLFLLQTLYEQRLVQYTQQYNALTASLRFHFSYRADPVRLSFQVLFLSRQFLPQRNLLLVAEPLPSSLLIISSLLAPSFVQQGAFCCCIRIYPVLVLIVSLRNLNLHATGLGVQFVSG